MRSLRDSLVRTKGGSVKILVGTCFKVIGFWPLFPTNKIIGFFCVIWILFWELNFSIGQKIFWVWKFEFDWLKGKFEKLEKIGSTWPWLWSQARLQLGKVKVLGLGKIRVLGVYRIPQVE